MAGFGIRLADVAGCRLASLDCEVGGCWLVVFASVRLVYDIGGVVVGVCSALCAVVAFRFSRRLLRPFVCMGRCFGAGIGLGFGFGFSLGFFLQQRLPVGYRDLIVVGMDFTESQEAVPIAAVVDEGGLQRRLDPRDLCQIDIAAERFACGRLVVELLYPGRCEAPRPGSLPGAWRQ